MKQPQIVTPAEWTRARIALLEKEKELTRARDALSAARRELPWERVEKQYAFDGPQGELSLGELFEGRSQLIIYHFMFAPDSEIGCRGCSFWADNFNGLGPHLNARDVTFAAISRAPLPKLRAQAQRFGWTFNWVSSGRTDFNFDYQASFGDAERQAGVAIHNYTADKNVMADKPGVSVFCRDESGAIFHTYSCYARGIDTLNTAYHYLDLTPKGRDEAGLSHPMAWVRLRDQYDVSA